MSDFPKRIVYVDDELDMRTIVRESIESSGFDGAFAACGSGQELFNRWAVLQPELLLLDIKMPNMDGLDTLDTLHQDDDRVGVPVIFVTGATKVEMLEKYNKLGVIGVIHKPFDLDALMESIKTIWDEYQASNEEPEDEPESD